MKKYLLGAALMACVLPACSQVNMGSQGAKTEATGYAGGATATGANAGLERCVSPFGTLAVNEDHSANWYSWMGRYGMQSTVPVLRLLAQQSNCFVVVERGAGMDSMMRERDLAQSGELRRQSNFGKGQMVAADYTVTPTLIMQDDNMGGVGGAVGGLFGTVGAAIGGSMRQQGAQSMMTLVDNRSGVQVAVAEGSASSMDIGGVFGMLERHGGGALSAYKRTPEGKLVVASMTDAFNNLVRATKSYRPQDAAGPMGHGTGGKLKVH